MLLSYRFKWMAKRCGTFSLQSPFNIIGHQYIEIGEKCGSRPGIRIECIDTYRETKFIPHLQIGDRVFFNFRCHIGVVNSVTIGDDVLIGSNVLIIDHAHGYNNSRDIETRAADRFLYSKGPIVIENNVWIGENVCILAGVTIGKNSVIGANTVVTKDVLPNCIVVGNPMRIIRELK